MSGCLVENRILRTVAQRPITSCIYRSDIPWPDIIGRIDQLIQFILSKTFCCRAELYITPLDQSSQNLKQNQLGL